MTTGASSPLAKLIEDRHRGAVRAVLNAKEELADPAMPAADAERLRRVIVDELGSLARLATSVLATLEAQNQDGYRLNQLWLESIAEQLGVSPPGQPDAEPVVAAGGGRGG